MSRLPSLTSAVECYLQSRRQLGFTSKNDQWALTGLARYAKRIGHRGPLTRSLAIGWAGGSSQTGPPQRARRLNMVSRFARFWQAFDDRTEIPPPDFFGPVQRRRPVHIYAAQEISALLEATAVLGPAEQLRAASMKTLLGLLACTGLRVGEALRLNRQDLDWPNGMLTVRQSKSGHQRLIPMRASAVAALRTYDVLRDQNLPAASSSQAFFLSSTGRRLPYGTVRDCFLLLRRHLNWTQRPVPRLHDLRHTFAVRCLLGWCQRQQPIGPRILTLSTYLGHRQVTDTYWYLSAVPELMALARNHFQTATRSNPL
jgi:integrase